jgi:peptide/nickel transport system substrate-binding protein
MLPIYPKHVHEPLADKADFGRRSPIGTGPYRVLQVDSNKGVLIERNTKYNMASPANPQASISRIQFLNIPDPGTQVAKLLTKEIEFTYGIDTEQGRQLGSTNPDLTYTYSGGMGVMYMAFDAKGRSGMKPIRDVRVRKALVLSVDRRALVELATSDPNFGPPPAAICSTIQAGCVYSVPVPAYDPAQAKRLLAEAGYPDGFDMEVTSFATPDNKRVAEAVAGYFRAVGVRASVDSPVQVAYRKKQSDGKIQLMIGPWTGGGLADVSFTLDLLYNPPDARDYHGDEEVKELALQVATTSNVAQRTAAAQKMFDLTIERAELIPLAPAPKFFVHTKDLTIGDAGRIVNFGAMPGDFKWK